MMKNKLEYIGSVLHQEQVSLVAIAETTGTPSFVYSKAKLLEQYQALKDALEGLNFKINYSVKANSNLSILSLLKDEGSGWGEYKLHMLKVQKLMVDAFQVEARNKDKLSDMSNLAEKLGGSNSSEND